jgi:hypothetical protein
MGRAATVLSAALLLLLPGTAIAGPSLAEVRFDQH